MYYSKNFQDFNLNYIILFLLIKSKYLAYDYALESLGNLEILKLFLDNDNLEIVDKFAIDFLENSNESVSFELILFLINHPRININFHDAFNQTSFLHFVLDGLPINIMMDNYYIRNGDLPEAEESEESIRKTQTLKLLEAILHSPKLSDATLNHYDYKVSVFKIYV